MEKIVIFQDLSDKIGFLKQIDMSLTLEQIIVKDLPDVKKYFIGTKDSLPKDVVFYDAWFINDYNEISIDLEISKSISHKIRKERRAKEFQPYDKIIALQIPGSDAINAEAERQKIRDKYVTYQTMIDEATSIDDLKVVLDLINNV